MMCSQFEIKQCKVFSMVTASVDKIGCIKEGWGHTVRAKGQGALGSRRIGNFTSMYWN